QREHKPGEQHDLKIHDREAELPRGPHDAKRRAAEEIIERPEQRARDLLPQWLRHLGADEVLLAHELVARRDPPVRAGGIDIPVRLLLGIERERPDLYIDRPDFQEALPGPLEYAVVALRPLRIVALDIEDVTPSDQTLPLAQPFLPLRARLRHEARWALP